MIPSRVAGIAAVVTLVLASSSPAGARDEQAPAAAGSCVANAETLCLLADRFALTVTWQNPYNGSQGSGRAVPRSDFTGFFSFGDPANLELMVKLLDFGSGIKVFYGQLTDFDFTLTIRDTRDGSVRTYGPTAGDCGGIDQAGFPSVALRAAARVRMKNACVPDGRTLCLLGGRFAVRASWSNPYNGNRGEAVPASLGNLSGLFSYDDPRNVELLVKVLRFGDRILVLYGALSDFAYELTVSDTATGRTRHYRNPGGRYCGGVDPDAQGVRFIPLGELAGGAVHSEAWGVSADGRTVAGASASAASSDRLAAFRWREGEGIVELADLGGGDAEGFAFGVSPSGALALGFGSRAEGREAVRWGVAGSPVGLGDAPGGTFSGVAYAASDDDRGVVGESVGAQGSEAVVWRDGTLAGLGDLPGGPFGSGARDISADGAVVVGFAHSAAGIEAFRWTAAGGMVALGDLAGGSVQSSATAVTADGRTIVGICVTEVGSEACRWSESGGPQRLASPVAGAQSVARDIAANGAFIVGSYSTAAGSHACAWLPSGAVLDLQAHLATLGADGLDGWTLEAATAVSADGTTIVGYGRDPAGARQAWLARLPAVP